MDEHCCGHPRPGETTAEAARRRLGEELGLGCGELRPAGKLRYRAEIADLVENELDHLLVTHVDGAPAPNPNEVVDWRFVAPDALSAWVAERPEDFTAWFRARVADRQSSSPVDNPHTIQMH